MSVLPSSATFASCFIVFALLVFLTLLTSFYPTILHQVKSIDLEALKGKLNGSLNTANAIAPEKLMDPSRVTSPLQKEDSKATKSRWIRYLLELRPRSESNPRNLFSAWVHGGILAIVFDFLVPELQFPRHQYNLYKNRHNKFLIASGWRWHPLAFVRDIVRLLLLPVWAALAIALLISWAVYKVIWCLTLCFVGCFTCFR